MSIQQKASDHRSNTEAGLKNSGSDEQSVTVLKLRTYSEHCWRYPTLFEVENALHWPAVTLPPCIGYKG